MGTIKAICISEKKGTVKREIPYGELVPAHGLMGDAHAGRWHRQVSLLSYEKIEAFKQRGVSVDNGAFGENLIVEGIDLRTLPIGTRFRIGDALLELTQIGKKCHAHCAIYAATGDCIMPREGVFAVVLKGGIVRPGDTIETIPASLYATLRDRQQDSDTMLFTDVGTGEKMLCIDGIFRGGAEHGFLRENMEELVLFNATGVTEIEGRCVFVEKIGGTPELILCGGGHVASALLTMAKAVGMRVTLIEDRESFAHQAEKLGADRVICAPYSEAIRKVPDSTDNYFVIMTRGHRFDVECLSEILRRPYAHVGMMGSRKRAAMVRETLTSMGLDASKLYSPIGLDIGAQTPEEIAVSVMAELIQVKRVHRSECYPDPEVLKALADSSEGAVLCTILAKHGSAPREVGTKMLVNPDGSVIGTIGGGRAEWKVIQDSKVLMAEKGSSPVVRSYAMFGDEIEDGGMVCGGTVEILMEEL